MRILAPLLLAICSGCYQQPLPGDNRRDSEHAQDANALLLRPSGPIADSGEILAPADEAKLGRQLRSIMERNQTAVVVVTVRSLAGQEVGHFARTLANQWNVGGPRGGVLILIAPNERKLRIETDKKVQRRLSDERCAEILKTAIIPRFRAGDYAGGIASGINAMQRYL